MHPHQTNMDVIKFEGKYEVRCTPKTNLPAIANSAEWEKVTKGRAGIGWDNVLDLVWMEIGGNQEEILAIEKFGGYATEIKKG